MAARKYKELKPADLGWTCRPDRLGFETTEDVERCTQIIGQERAVAAFKLGLNVPSVGYNIFVSGLTGTGRTSTVVGLLEGITRDSKAPPDRMYVHNFRHPESPRLITLPAGQGRSFKKMMDWLVKELQNWIPQAFRTDVFRAAQQELAEGHTQQQNEMFKALQEEMAQEGFGVVRIQMGTASRPDIMPLVEGKPVSFEQLLSLVQAGDFPQEEAETLQKKYAVLKDQLDQAFAESRRVARAFQEKLEALQVQHVDSTLKQDLDEIADQFPSEAVREFLSEIYEAITSNLDRFEPDDEPTPSPGSREDPFRYFRVNLLVDNGDLDKAPVIIETSPSYRNLFGTIERPGDPTNNLPADFLDIRTGSVIRADGGYLVLNLLDAAGELGVWPRLKRILRHREITIQGPEALHPLAASSLNPEPIPLSLKVIVIGEEETYQLLRALDPDFGKIFKVKAEFESSADRKRGRIREYAKFVSRLCQDEGHPHLTAEAVARLLEEAVRRAGWKKKLSARFSDLADIIREAGYWARKNGCQYIDRTHIDRSIQQREYRVSSLADRVEEILESGTLLVDTKGQEIGQVNALAVFDLGDHAFGKPSRITAVTTAGKAGIINIEREAKLSGKSHDKGVMILTGYLRRLFAQKKPLALTCSIAFEQSYGMIDGDSASSTEVYAILSSLSGLPIRQDLAVTGSVNQKGEVQAIGGVNHKIEGWFEICKARGLTGDQGVLIPASNVQHLALRREVIEAVERGEFHVYPVKTIPQGIRILTGVTSGRQRADGTYSPTSVFGKAGRRLKELAEAAEEDEDDKQKK